MEQRASSNCVRSTAPTASSRCHTDVSWLYRCNSGSGLADVRMLDTAATRTLVHPPPEVFPRLERSESSSTRLVDTWERKYSLQRHRSQWSSRTIFCRGYEAVPQAGKRGRGLPVLGAFPARPYSGFRTLSAQFRSLPRNTLVCSTISQTHSFLLRAPLTDCIDSTKLGLMQQAKQC